MTLDQVARYAKYVVVGAVATGLIVGAAAAVIIFDAVVHYTRRPGS